MVGPYSNGTVYPRQVRRALNYLVANPKGLDVRVVTRFYTMSPRQIPYPYLLTNAAEGPRSEWKYQTLLRRNFKHAILDAGVEHFLRNSEAQEYPTGFLDRYKWKARQLSQIFGEKLWVTICDYMDDYHPGQVRDNVGKTLHNIEDFIHIEGVNWLPVLQARYLDVLSFYESCHQTEKLLGNFPRLAIGTVCKTRNLAFILECCRIARKFFPTTWIHAFGPSLNIMPKVAPYVDSWDSSAWTFPRGRGKPSANTSEYPRFFRDYLKRIRELMGDTAELS